MKKNTLFLSAAITTFILVILASVFLKARNGGSVASAAAASAVPVATSTQAPTDTLQPTNTATSVPTATGYISPQEAVFIASNALGNTQVYSVDTETRYGLDVYKVTFSSGHIVFVSPDGHILAIETPHAVYVAPTPDQQSADGGGGGGGGGGKGGGDDHGGDDHGGGDD
jgi:uncharacterized membrane protein YgcG